MSRFAVLKRLDSAHFLAERAPWLTPILRFLSYLVYRGLEVVLGSRHPHTRVLRQARRLEATGAGEPAGAGGTVLFFTVRGWFPHVATEAIWARALKQRGVATTFFLCGGRLTQCDFKPASDPHVTRPLCWRCTDYASRLLGGFGLDHLRMEEVIDVDSLLAEAQKRVATLSRTELLEFSHAGAPLGQYVVPSVQRSLLSGSIPEDDRSVDILRGFVAAAVVTVELCDRLLDRVAPEAVILTNGLFFMERIMLEAARRRGVRVVAYERGIPANSMIVAVDKPAVPFDVDPYWSVARTRPLADEESRRLDELVARRRGGNVGVQRIWPEMDLDGHAALERLGLDPDVGTAAMFTNILWDTAVFDRNVAFDGMFDWVVRTVRAFEQLPDRQLVVRIHPAEVRLDMARSRERVADRLTEEVSCLPDNVRLVLPDDPASSYALMALADQVLVYTSTIGLEAALMGKSVVVAGDTHYRGRGFTVDIERSDDYAAILASVAHRTPLDDERFELARRYGHCFFFEYMRPFPWFDDRSRDARALTFGNLADLDAGHDPALDELCDLVIGRATIPLRAPV